MTSIAPRLGRTLLLIASAALFYDAGMQLQSAPSMMAAMEHIGYPPDFGPTLSLLTFSCALLLALPATSVAGAVLMTGFLGGAIAVHVPASGFGAPPQIVCVAIGIAAWTGLLLVEPRLAAIIDPRQGRPASNR